MANGAAAPPGLAFPQATFAKLTPAPFLHAHLKRSEPLRPNGRTLTEFRQPMINTGSLSHSNGSAVVRLGDTAVVCGVRAELLMADDIPHPPSDDVSSDSIVEELGLLVPNVELSTGCSPNHLPGNPPGTQAQSLSYQISSLLYASNLIDIAPLRVKYKVPHNDEEYPNADPQTVIKAYWTLYIDILCIALDGNPFDAAWTAAVAALQDTSLPKAWWDPDREIVVSSPLADDASALVLNHLPVSATFAVFSTLSPLKPRGDAQSWVLADPDGFEEDLCAEIVTVVVSMNEGRVDRILRLEKYGGGVVSRDAMAQCLNMTRDRSTRWEAALKGD